MAKEVPIWEKANLTLEEAAAYSGIGTGKLREITNDKNCNFVLWVGNKRLIKKRLFDKFIEQAFSIEYLQISHRKRSLDVILCRCHIETPFE